MYVADSVSFSLRYLVAGKLPVLRSEVHSPPIVDTAKDETNSNITLAQHLLLQRTMPHLSQPMTQKQCEYQPSALTVLDQRGPSNRVPPLSNNNPGAGNDSRVTRMLLFHPGTKLDDPVAFRFFLRFFRQMSRTVRVFPGGHQPHANIKTSIRQKEIYP